MPREPRIGRRPKPDRATEVARPVSVRRYHPSSLTADAHPQSVEFLAAYANYFDTTKYNGLEPIPAPVWRRAQLASVLA